MQSERGVVYTSSYLPGIGLNRPTDEMLSLLENIVLSVVWEKTRHDDWNMRRQTQAVFARALLLIRLRKNSLCDTSFICATTKFKPASLRTE